MRSAIWILCMGYAAAAGAGPYSLSYGGRFADADNTAIAGPVDIEVRFYRTASGGSQIGPVVAKTTVNLVDGVFQIDLDELSPTDLHAILSSTDSTYIEIKDLTHGVSLPRQILTAVPYAQKVPVDGKTVTYAANGVLRLGVPGTPASNQFLTMDANGNLLWAAPSSSGSSGGPWSSTDIVDGTITNADISAGAAIAASKISGLGALASAGTVSGGTGGTIADGTITNDDIAPGAAIASSKIAGLGGLATLTAVSGGSSGTISDGTITNDDIAPGAAIASSKIAGLGGLATLTAVSGGSSGTISDGTITNDDIAPGAAIASSKIAGLGGLATLTAVSGGSSGTISDGTITNDDIAPGAAIASSKISGLGNLATLGSVSGSTITDGTITAADIATGTLTNNLFATGSISQLPAPDGLPANALIIDNDGKVGIGTTAPGANLQVNTASSSTRGFVVKATSGQSADLFAALTPSDSAIARVTSAGEFSNPNPEGGSGTGNERFGSGAGSNMTTGIGNTLIGNAAGSSVTTGNSNTLIGKFAASALASGHGNVVIGDNAGSNTTGNYNTIIGTDADTQGSLNGCLALGWGSTCTAGNQMVAGSGGIRVDDIYFGNGVVNSPTYGATVNATGGTGTDVVGANLTLAGGKSTGNAAGGDLIFKTSPSGTAGSSVNGLVEAMRVTSTRNVGIGTSSPTALLEVNGEARLGVLRTNGAVYSKLRAIRHSNASLSISSGSPTDLSATDHYVFVDAEANGDVYVRLPDATAAGSGRSMTLRGKSSNGMGPNDINISTLGGTINGTSTLILDAGTSTVPGTAMTFISDGTNWFAF